jgi:lipopolysaccharide export system protein LptC
MLPFAGILAIVVIIASLFLSGSDLASVELGAIRLEKGKLVMDKPELNGTDSNKRPYHLTAAKAVQDTEKPDRISLEAIKASLPLNDSQTATITAGTGVYDVGEKKLRLGGGIAVDTDDGMKIRMNDAQIDIGTGEMRTENPIEVDTGRASVKAESLMVRDNGKIIIFENRVRMTILPFSDPENGEQPRLAPKPATTGIDDLADRTE